MDARFFRGLAVCAAMSCLGAGYKTPNFIVVQAPSAELAREVGDTAERLRRELAVEWTGQALPNWSRPCPISAKIAPHLGAGGATSFVFHHGEVFDWNMNVQGSRERVLDSVLPHEITHTVFASHFRQPLPRWADEGACTTVEHDSERDKQHRMLIEFLKTGRGISFNHMFAMREYPPDILPLYAQGYSLARYLIDQGGKHKFMQYVGEGLKSEDWPGVTERYYGDQGLGQLQDRWLDWVRAGSPLQSLPDGAPERGDNQILLASADASGEPAPIVYRGQQKGRLADAIGKLVPGGGRRRQAQPTGPSPEVGVPGWDEPPRTLPQAHAQAIPLAAAAPGQPLAVEPPNVQPGAESAYAMPAQARIDSGAVGFATSSGGGAGAASDQGWHPSIEAQQAAGAPGTTPLSAQPSTGNGRSIYASGLVPPEPSTTAGGPSRQVVLEWSRIEEMASRQRYPTTGGSAPAPARAPTYDASRATGTVLR